MSMRRKMIGILLGATFCMSACASQTQSVNKESEDTEHVVGGEETETVQTGTLTDTNKENTQTTEEFRTFALEPEGVTGYIETVQKYEENHEALEGTSLHYALIDFNGDEIPELVAGMDGYFVSMYTYADGEVTAVMDEWAYGAGGNAGYEYLPGENVLYNVNHDFAGAIEYEYYAQMDEDAVLISLYEEELSKWYFDREKVGDGWPEEKDFLEEPDYYINDTKVSKEEYQSYLIPGEYEYICGDQSAEEIIEKIKSL